MLVTKVSTIIVPSIEVQTRNPAVQRMLRIQRRQINIERNIPHRMNCHEVFRSAIILSPRPLRPRALLRAPAASSSVSRETSPVGLSVKTVLALAESVWLGLARLGVVR